MMPFVDSRAWIHVTSLLLCTTFTASCATRQASKPVIPEGRPAMQAGYLSVKEMPDSLALVPAPPASGSTGLAQDEAVYQEARTLRGTPRWDQAVLDAVLSFPQAAGTFECALDTHISEQDTP